MLCREASVTMAEASRGAPVSSWRRRRGGAAQHRRPGPRRRRYELRQALFQAVALLGGPRPAKTSGGPAARNGGFRHRARDIGKALANTVSRVSVAKTEDSLSLYQSSLVAGARLIALALLWSPAIAQTAARNASPSRATHVPARPTTTVLDADESGLYVQLP